MLWLLVLPWVVLDAWGCTVDCALDTDVVGRSEERIWCGLLYLEHLLCLSWTISIYHTGVPVLQVPVLRDVVPIYGLRALLCVCLRDCVCLRNSAVTMKILIRERKRVIDIIVGPALQYH